MLDTTPLHVRAQGQMGNDDANNLPRLTTNGLTVSCQRARGNLLGLVSTFPALPVAQEARDLARRYVEAGVVVESFHSRVHRPFKGQTGNGASNRQHPHRPTLITHQSKPNKNRNRQGDSRNPFRSNQERD